MFTDAEIFYEYTKDYLKSANLPTTYNDNLCAIDLIPYKLTDTKFIDLVKDWGTGKIANFGATSTPACTEDLVPYYTYVPGSAKPILTSNLAVQQQPIVILGAPGMGAPGMGAPGMGAPPPIIPPPPPLELPKLVPLIDREYIPVEEEIDEYVIPTEHRKLNAFLKEDTVTQSKILFICLYNCMLNYSADIKTQLITTINSHKNYNDKNLYAPLNDLFNEFLNSKKVKYIGNSSQNALLRLVKHLTVRNNISICSNYELNNINSVFDRYVQNLKKL